MRWLINFLLVFLLPAVGLAQDVDNYIEVAATGALNFVLSDPADIENDQVIPNAVRVSVRSRRVDCSVYARMSAFNAPPGFVPSAGPLSLDWSYDNSNKDYNLITSAIEMTTFDKLLFNQKKMPGNNKDAYDYYYNLVLAAPGYSYVPGTYTFTLTFTMTQP